MANTLVIADGRTTAHNTDVAGVREALAELGVVSAPESPYVLGGGGTRARCSRRWPTWVPGR